MEKAQPTQKTLHREPVFNKAAPLEAAVPPLQEPARQAFFLTEGRRLTEEKQNVLGHTPTACVITFGCQMNARDSEKIRGMLEKMGYTLTEDERADVVVYNTCTVRENANTRVYGRLGRLHRFKKEHPAMRIILCGCMMQEAGVSAHIREKFPFVNLIFGTHNLYCFPELFVRMEREHGLLIDTREGDDILPEELPVKRKYAFKCGVNITYGCNNFCTYCIVPYVRGRERSRRPEEILEEIRTLAGDGVKEVMLLGQNVNSYGKTLPDGISFAELLQKTEAIDGISRIRFMTSHPKDLSDELIATMAASKKICRHLHLPVQSGSSRILRQMNRHYTKEDYLSLVGKIREKIPDMAITTDIMVGFPGETEADFEDTLDVVRRVRFENAFTFLYSKRSGTKAAAMENQVPETVARERFDRLLHLVQTIAAEETAKKAGHTEEVLVEAVNEKDSAFLTGRLSNNTVVHFKGERALIGRLVPVRITRAKGFYYIGEMVHGTDDAHDGGLLSNKGSL